MWQAVVSLVHERVAAFHVVTTYLSGQAVKWSGQYLQRMQKDANYVDGTISARVPYQYSTEVACAWALDTAQTILALQLI